MTSSPLRIARLAALHLHAAGWLRVMLDNPEVEVMGVHDPGRKLF